MGKTVLESTKQLCRVVLVLIANMKKPIDSRIPTAEYDASIKKIHTFLTTSPQVADLSLSLKENKLIPESSDPKFPYDDTPFALITELADLDLLRFVLALENAKISFCSNLGKTPFNIWIARIANIKSKEAIEIAASRDRKDEIQSYYKRRKITLSICIADSINYLAAHNVDIFASPGTQKAEPFLHSIILDLVASEIHYKTQMCHTIYMLEQYKKNGNPLSSSKLLAVARTLGASDSVHALLRPHLDPEEEDAPEVIVPARYNVVYAFHHRAALRLTHLEKTWEGRHICPLNDVFKFVYFHHATLIADPAVLHSKESQRKVQDFFKQFNANLALYIENIDAYELFIKAGKHHVREKPNFDLRKKVASNFDLFFLILHSSLLPHIKFFLDTLPENYTDQTETFVKHLKDSCQIIYLFLEENPKYADTVYEAKLLFTLCKKLQFNIAQSKGNKALADNYNQKIITQSHALVSAIKNCSTDKLKLLFMSHCGAHLFDFYVDEKRWKTLYKLWGINVALTNHVKPPISPFVGLAQLKAYIALLEVQLDNDRKPELDLLIKQYEIYESITTLTVTEEISHLLETALLKCRQYLNRHYMELKSALSPYATNDVTHNTDTRTLTLTIDLKTYSAATFQPDYEKKMKLSNNQLVISDALTLVPTVLNNILEQWKQRTTLSLDPTIALEKQMNLLSMINSTHSVPDEEDTGSSSSNPQKPPDTFTPCGDRKRKVKTRPTTNVAAIPEPEIPVRGPLDALTIVETIRKHIPEDYHQLTVVEYPNGCKPPMRSFYAIKKTDDPELAEYLATVNTRGHDPKLGINIDKAVDPYGKGNAGAKICGNSIRLVNPNGYRRPTGRLYKEIPLDDKNTVAKLFLVNGMSNHARLRRGQLPTAF